MHGGTPTRGRGREPVTSAPPGAADPSATTARCSRRPRRLLALAAVAAGGLLAGAPGALADTVVTRESGDFGIGRGDFVHVRDARSLIFDTRVHVEVRRDGDDIVVTDAVGQVLAGDDCVAEGAQVRCSAAGLEGLKLEGSTENDVISNRTDLIAEILGDSGNDLLQGGSNRDRINGQRGDDSERGGAGADIFRAEPGNDVLDGQEGDFDTVSYAGASGPVAVSLGEESGPDGITGEKDQVQDVENALGSAFVDSITGSDADNVLRGGGGKDTISGGGGDDLLDGGPGGDILDGGAGVDTADYSLRRAAVAVSLDGRADDGNAEDDSAIDNVKPSVDNVLGGSGGDTLTGNGSPNRLSGGGGNDTLDGGQGADVFAPGAGTDTVIYTDDRLAGVQVTLDGLANDGSFQDDARDASRDNVPADTEILRGSRFDDVLEGNNAPNRLEGGDGSDTIRGLGSGDVLDGQGGADALDGGDDADRLLGGADGDLMIGGASIDTADYRDHVAGVTVTLDGQANDGAPAENDNVQTDHVIGTEEDDDITGDTDANVLNGLGGDDRLEGGAGRDGLFAGPGDDTVDADDEELDTPIDCGPGLNDKTFVDRIDRDGAIIVGCETVFVEALRELPS